MVGEKYTTKGEWEIRDHKDKNFVEIIVPYPSGVGRQSLGLFRKADLMPIVYLIASAPDLYKACKALIERMNGSERLYLADIERMAEKAIAKVGGK